MTDRSQESPAAALESELVGVRDAGTLRLIEVLAYQNYRSTLVGNPAPVVKQLGDRMRDVRVGDLALEVTTIYHPDRLGERLGRLVRIAEEPVFTPEQWADGGGENEPIPTHTVWYLRLPDGREYGWYNASFIAVPTDITNGFERPFMSDPNVIGIPAAAHPLTGDRNANP